MSASPDPAWPRLVDEVRRAFAGSPYRVDATADAITVQADLADARFLGLASIRRLRTIVRTRLTPKDAGRVVWEDEEETLAWSAGLDGALMPRLSGRVEGMRGRIAKTSFRMELGVDEHGLGLPVDEVFSSAEIRKPLEEAVRRAGFRTAMARSTMIGIVAAAVGGGGALVAGIVLAALALTGTLG